MRRLLNSLRRSLAVAVRNDPELQRSVAARARLWAWLGRRLGTTEPFGLRLTFGSALAAARILHV